LNTSVAALSVEDIHTYYGESYVLQGLSLAVERGTVAAVLGRNGVGKTTLIRSVMSFSPPRRGRVLLEGRDITAWPAHRVSRAGIALVPQGRRIFPSLSVQEHLTMAIRRPKDRVPDEGAHQASSVEWRVGTVYEWFPRLRERASVRAGALSGGERQMLAVARALVANPCVLLMDEPTEGLSPSIVESLRRLVLEWKKAGLSILLVEQNLAFVLAVADYAYVMDKGRLVHACAPRDLLENERVKQVFLGI